MACSLNCPNEPSEHAHGRGRTAAALTLLDPGSVLPPDDEDLPLAYALAHQRLEGAENAAYRRDATTLDWYHNAAGPALARLAHSSRLGLRSISRYRPGRQPRPIMSPKLEIFFPRRSGGRSPFPRALVLLGGYPEFHEYARAHFCLLRREG